jgi:glycosyltransferase involved in cell wall biosynthesis
MKKTLLLCNFHPLASQFGSTMRTMNFVSFFRNFGLVDLCYNESGSMDKTERSPFSNEYFLDKMDFPGGLRDHLFRFLKGVPYPIREYRNESQKLLKSLIRSGDYDYILVRYIHSAGAPNRLTSAAPQRIIVDFDDIMSNSLYESFFYPSTEILKKLLRQLNKKLLWSYERRFLRFGASLFCSEKDRVTVAREKNKNTFVVPNVYDDISFGECKFEDGFWNSNILLFVGALNYVANIEGLKWFLTSIYEELRKKHSDLRLLVVGRASAREVRDLCERTQGVELHADVPDIKEYYRRCRAVVVPLLAGGGTRIKILEAALAGRPILATPVGAEGLDFKDGRDLLLFENAGEFCSAYEGLFDMNRYESIVQNARTTVKGKYSAKVFEEAMKRVVDYVDRF